MTGPAPADHGPLQGPCPGTAEIERLAAGDAPSPDSARHVETCEVCRARLQIARDDSNFLSRVRNLTDTEGPHGAPRLSGYRILGVISTGAQGVVYRAMQESTSRTVAIKVLVSGETASPRQRARAEREAEIAARLRHPNIVTVFESRNLSDGRVAVVMEFIDGVPLDQWEPPAATDAERLREQLRGFVALCSGVHHAHLNGVIHRDLKPDNILVTGDGRPVVLDFGIAKVGGIRTTVTGEFAGTPAYASPEQASGRSGMVDALTDVYSLGVILYRLACNAVPYDLTGSLLEIARTISEAEPIPPRTRNPALSADLEAIILRAMRKEKERRYQSAAELARDVERYLSGDPVEARSESGWYVLRKAVAINRKRLTWVAVAVVGLLGAGLAVTLSLSLAALQGERARAENVRARAVTELLKEIIPNEDPTHPELGVIGAGLYRLYYRLEAGAFASDPELDQALRRLWGGVYTGLGSGRATAGVEFSEVSLRNGLERLRMQHGAEHPDIAATMHELAGVLLVRKRSEEAEDVARAALAMRLKLLGPKSPAVADSHALLARILIARGRPDAAADETDAAIVLLRTLPERDADARLAWMTALKARARLDAHRLSDCEPLIREALSRRLRLLAPEDPDLHASLADAAEFIELVPGSDLAKVLGHAWQPGTTDLSNAIRADLPILRAPLTGNFYRAARSGHTQSLARLARLQEALLGPDDVSLVRTLFSQMRAAESEHIPGAKSVAALRAADVLSKRFGPDHSAVLICIEEAAATLIFEGKPEEAAVLAQRSCDIRYKIPQEARDVLVAPNSRRHLAWYLTMAGKHAQALPEWRQCIAELRTALGPDHYVVVLAESGMAVSLADTGKLEHADALSARCLSVGESASAISFDQLGNIRFARGRVLMDLARDAKAHGRDAEARTRFTEARAMMTRAWDTTYRFGGTLNPWRRQIVSDLAEACRELGDGPGAVLWLAEMDHDPAFDPTGQ